MEKKDLNPKAVALVFAIVAALGIAYAVFCLSGIDKKKSGSTEALHTEFSASDFGSARRLEGKTAIVTIFASDKTDKWDMESEYFFNSRANTFNYLEVAADWITEQGKAYGKELEFVYPKDEKDSLLYYEGELNDTAAAWNSTAYQLYHSGGAVWEYIDLNIDSNRIKSETDCDNIVYLVFMKTLEKTNSFAFGVYDQDLEKPYEFAICCFHESDNSLVAPAVVAHEMLHLFGAADLYKEDNMGVGYHVSNDMVKYVEKNYPEDIMFSTLDRDAKMRMKKSITQEITPVTAYYLGWVSEPPFDITAYGADHNQFTA